MIVLDQRCDQRRQAVLSVNHPKRPIHLRSVNRQGAEVDLRGRRSTLPEQQRTDWEASPYRIEKRAHVPFMPAKAALERRATDGAFGGGLDEI